MKKITILFVFLFLCPASFYFSQSNYEKKIVTVIPGEEYEAGWLHNFFFGDHWRDLWITPVQVEVLNLANFAGGLTPMEKGGGYQTLSLRFKGNDGRTWKFRTINKNPTKILPLEVQETVVSDILQDQISSSNPLAPLVVAPFLNAAGILHSKPNIVLMPDDEKLGEFRSEFGGLLGIIEEHPDEGGNGKTSFENADKIKGTYKLFEALEKKPEQKVDKTEYLKARLIDIFLGDWDRHTDQWRWAGYEKGEDKIWQPIPRDRDQAFAKYDGIFPAIAAYVIPQLTSFGYSYPQVEDITWNGRFLDRRFLSEIKKNEWDSVATFVHNILTNELIETAVHQLPEEFYNKAGEELISKLKSRKDKIFKFSNDYYEFINEVVEIFCSEKDDLVEVSRLSDYETEIILKENSETEKDPPYYSKVFNNNLTKEFRINLLGGDDKVVVNGNVNRSPLIRIIGGSGKDELEDNSKVDGYFLLATPFPDAETKTIMYDRGDETKIKFGSGTCWNDDKYPDPDNETEKYEPKLRDRGHDWLYKPLINYNSDDGIILGSGFLLNSYNFRAHPLEYTMDFSAGYATNPKSIVLSFNGKFYSLVQASLLNLDFYYSELSLTKYFGFGNETVYDRRRENSDYYQLQQELFSFHPALKFPIYKNISGNLEFSLNYSDISIRNDTLLGNFTPNRYGLNSFTLAGIHSGVEFDSRDVSENPYKGFYLNFSGSFYPEIFDNKNLFAKAGFDARTYFTANFITDITLALRAGGEKLYGTYPFFKAAFLGGSNNLRGYSRERFSGNASLFGQAELRFFLTDIKLIINGRFGFFTFAETGRVFAEKESSEKWHPSYGGGFWISYLNRTINLNLALANSNEVLTFYFLTRFMF